MSSNGCEIALYDSIFRGNTASSDGGAMLLVSESELTVIESTFQKNAATVGDGDTAASIHMDSGCANAFSMAARSAASLLSCIVSTPGDRAASSSV